MHHDAPSSGSPPATPQPPFIQPGKDHRSLLLPAPLLPILSNCLLSPDMYAFLKSHSIVNAALFPSSGTLQYDVKSKPTSLRSSIHILLTRADLKFPSFIALCSTSKRVMLYFHGNATNLFEAEKMLELYAADVGVTILAPEYPGYGPAQGRSTEDSIDENASATLRWILDKGVKPEDIIIYGCSIGSGVAVKLAAELCAKSTPPCALILQSPYTCVSDVVQSLLGPYIALLLLPRWRSLDRIRLVTCPTLFIHGEYDSTIPLEHSALLHAASPALIKHVALIPADHNSFKQLPHIIRPAKDFLEKILGDCVLSEDILSLRGANGMTGRLSTRLG